MYGLMPHCELNEDGARELTDCLRDDKKLILALCNKSKDISPGDFISGNTKWAQKNNADIFYICESGKPIGMISLSKQNREEKTACVGYWLASRYWNRGYTSRAFADIIGYAGEKGIMKLSARIGKSNVYSLRLWEKRGASKHDLGDRYLVELRI